ncbi:MAG: hypothetical protein KAS32_22715 [Candidatus Peribacteraceae bacterium]|nr:hypothetical protein [Candidatus Peribacteraceae bacterium]
MAIDVILKIVSQLGVPVALVIFFVWNNNVREKALTQRLTDLEDYTRNKLEKIIINYAEIAKESTNTLKQVKDILEN